MGAEGEDASGAAMSSTSVDGTGDAGSTADGSVNDQFALAFGDSMTMGDGAAAATAADAAFDGEANSGSTTSSTSVDGTGNANADTTATGDDGPIANANGDSTANGDGAAADGSAAADFADEDASGSAMS